MRHLFFILAITLSLTSLAQNAFPYTAALKDVNGKTVDSKTFTNGGKPVVIDFWASWCVPCIIKYNSMKEVYTKWQEETGVRIIAVSIDNNPQAIAKAKEMAAKYGWPFEIYFDEEKKLFSQLTSEEAVPNSFFYDKDLKLVTNKTGASIAKKGNGNDHDAVTELMTKKNGKIDDFETNLEDYYNTIKKIAGIVPANKNK